MFGVFQESGPFRLVSRTRLQDNPDSWHRGANLLFIDSPVGYDTSQTFDNNNNIVYLSRLLITFETLPQLPLIQVFTKSILHSVTN